MSVYRRLWYQPPTRAGSKRTTVAHRGWEGSKDGQLLKHLIDEELIFVTNNRDDFVALVSDVELHPGLVIILENVPRDDQVNLFTSALDTIGAMPSLIR